MSPPESPPTRGEIVMLLNLADDLVRAVEARRQLDSGFKGMGVNILVENANRMGYTAMKLRALVDRLRAGGGGTPK